MTHLTRILPGILALALAACGGKDPAPARESREASEARPQPPAGIGCGWQLVSDIDTTNIAFPDQAATYWIALVPNLPQSRLRIDGRYPAARYFSYNVYDPLIRPVDAIADYEIAPEQTGSNPYVNPQAQPGAAYTAYIEFTAKPETRAPNTVYSGFIPLTAQRMLPNPLLTPLIYRVYVPAGDRADGGVGLPVLTLETQDGARELLPFADCAAPLAPRLGDHLPPPGLNAALLQLDYPEPAGVLRFPTATYPPRATVFYGLPDTLLRILGNLSPAPPPEALRSTEIGSGGGFLSNRHNAYIASAFSRSDGGIVLMRGRAPSWQGDPRRRGAAGQLRYWSVCQNEFVSQRFVACAADYQTSLDAEGFFTVVVSDASERPANATAEHGFAWLPWGPYPDALLIYRHMLPAPDFAEAIQNVPQGSDPRTVMGDYFPVVTYCSRATFEAAGNEPAAVLQACDAETRARAQETGYLGVLPPAP